MNENQEREMFEAYMLAASYSTDELAQHHNGHYLNDDVCAAWWAWQARAALAAKAVPAGWKLVAVNAAFDDLMYWLDRCDDKGHLDNCSDLIEPWAAFDYKTLSAATPAPAPEARCQCGLKPASECEPWEPGCDLGRNPDHVLVHRATPESHVVRAPAPAPLTVTRLLDLMPDSIPARHDRELIDFARAVERACAEAWGVKLAGIGASSGGKP